MTDLPELRVVCFSTNSLRRAAARLHVPALPAPDRVPAGPWLMYRCGQLLRPLIFTRPA